MNCLIGDNVCRFTGRRKAACNGELTVVLNDGSTFLAVVLFELLVGLDDRDDTQLSGSGCTVHPLPKTYAELVKEWNEFIEANYSNYSKYK